MKGANEWEFLKFSEKAIYILGYGCLYLIMGLGSGAMFAILITGNHPTDFQIVSLASLGCFIGIITWIIVLSVRIKRSTSRMNDPKYRHLIETANSH
jgi:hypothetical protein